MKNIRYIICIFSALIFFENAFSFTSSIKFDKITTLDGLSQNTIYTIIQDKTGYLWFATQDGLNRYDGYNFKVLRTSQGLNANDVYTLEESADHKLWIGTSNNGINIYNPRTGKLSDLEDGKKLKSKNITKIVSAENSTLWVATSGGGLYNFDLDGQLLNYFDTKNSDLPSNDISTMYLSNSGILWIGTLDKGIIKFNPQENDFTKLIHSTNRQFNNSHITAINEDSSGQIWIGTSGSGIFIIEDPGKNFNITKIDAPPDKIGLNFIRDIFRDSENNIWIGTEGGLRFYNHINNEITDYFSTGDPNGLNSNQIYCLYEDKTGIVWVGSANAGINRFSKTLSAFKNHHINSKYSTNSSETIWSIYENKNGKWFVGSTSGLTIYNPQDSKIMHFSSGIHETALTHSIVRCIYKHSNGHFYLGTDGGGVNVFNPEKRHIEPLQIADTDNIDLRIRDIIEDSTGNLWIATMGGLVYYDIVSNKTKLYSNKIDDEKSLSDNRILDLHLDRVGNLWVATFKGLEKFDPVNKEFITYRHIPGDPSSLSFDLVITIFESAFDPHGILWIGTSSGLNRFDTESATFKSYKEENGLINNVIYSITEDKNGYLWSATSRGISRFDRDTEEFTNYDISDGIENIEFNANACIVLKNNNILFGGVFGITEILPDFIEENTNKPKTVITSFKKYDQQINVDSLVANDKTLQLSHNDKFISVEFAALDFTSPRKNKFRYMLEGFDDEWIYSDTRNFASYTNLDGGKYTFKVQGTNNAGIWSETVAQLKIQVTPPFWRTIWFFTLSIWTIILILFYIYKKRVDKEKKLQGMLQEKVNGRTKELYKRNLELKKTQKEKDRILKNVEEGFFLLDEKLQIQSQFSSAMEDIFECQNIAYNNLIDILKKFLPDKLIKTTKEYIELLFQKDIDEELISELNPLIKTEFNFLSQNFNSGKLKFLSIKFKRIYENDDIIGLIVTVTDETEEFLLSKKLEETEQKSQKQLQWLVGILHLEPKLVNEFMESTYSELNKIEILLESDNDFSKYHDILREASKSLHLIKGNANLLELNFVADKVHEIENEIILLTENQYHSSNDYLNLVTKINQLQADLNEINRLLERVSKFGTNKSPELKKNSEESIFNMLEKIVNRLSINLNKTVRLNIKDFKPAFIPENYKNLTSNILVQMIRNSLSHGIESPKERKMQQKNETGEIVIKTELKKNYFILTFRDDGRGLQLEKLHKKALEANIWPINEVQGWNEQQIIGTIFEPGISTNENADLYSGRGIGMDLVKDMVQNNRGKIDVSFETNKYCQFIIKLPVNSQN